MRPRKLTLWGSLDYSAYSKLRKDVTERTNHELGYILGDHKKEIENKVTTYLVNMYVFVDLERSSSLSYGN